MKEGKKSRAVSGVLFVGGLWPLAERRAEQPNKEDEPPPPTTLNLLAKKSNPFNPAEMRARIELELPWRVSERVGRSQ